ncbi:uncharacterized protein JN550_007170 [Neoarthrinium moseri]|uniref:uncharacterized protein n=1 Tax=Neoarthrinium moseri TaxID=1658444 RepID=UPI001FDB3CEA|nr:uncharacterized protein JN550_007170 [Neoarthrinium moseri]KAI1867118.1 hypothetical protein JN550_007170 [Neoarthrinium moseri]
MQTEESNRAIIRLLTAAKMRVNAFMHFPALESLDFILTSLPSKDRRDFQRIITDIINTRISEEDKGQYDLYALMAEHTKPGGIYENILWSEAIFFMTAGGTPPATAMSALFFYLSRFPKCYERLAKEIRTKFSSGHAIQSGATLASCKYLRACINESLRMAPPSLATLWREQAADDLQRGSDPFVIDGHIIPPGTQFGVNLYAMHHNEKYFPDPFTFNPDRWVSTDSKIGESDESGRHRAFAPFIVGPRSCAGKPMAYSEVSLVIAKTLWYFDFQKAPGPLGEIGQGNKWEQNEIGHVNEFQIRDMFNENHQGPYLTFTPRDSLHHELRSLGT